MLSPRALIHNWTFPHDFFSAFINDLNIYGSEKESISYFCNFKFLITSFGGMLLLYGLYWIIFVPWHWVKDYTEVGYKTDTKRSFRKDAINRARKLRKMGKKLPPPYPNGWYGILESNKLKPGGVHNIDCLGENFVIFRTKSNDVHILDAYCSHLGANLGVGGQVRGDCIECPFHQWQFRGSDGECVNIPYTLNGNIPKNTKIRHWKSYEINGQIFVWYHAEKAEPWQIPHIKEINNGDWMFQGRNEYLINCHIQEIPENGADVAHLNAVHGNNMMAGSDLRKTQASWAKFATHIWNAQWMPPNDIASPHIATVTLTQSVNILNKFSLGYVRVDAEQIGPSYVLLRGKTAFGPIFVIQTLMPVEPLIQKVIHRFYAPKYMSLYMKLAVFAESIMFERDVMIWNSKTFLDAPLLVKEDKLIKSFRSWYSQFYSENSIDFKMAKESMSW